MCTLLNDSSVGTDDLVEHSSKADRRFQPFIWVILLVYSPNIVPGRLAVTHKCCLKHPKINNKIWFGSNRDHTMRREQRSRKKFSPKRLVGDRCSSLGCFQCSRWYSLPQKASMWKGAFAMSSKYHFPIGAYFPVTNLWCRGDANKPTYATQFWFMIDCEAWTTYMAILFLYKERLYYLWLWKFYETGKIRGTGFTAKPCSKIVDVALTRPVAFIPATATSSKASSWTVAPLGETIAETIDCQNTSAILIKTTRCWTGTL